MGVHVVKSYLAVPSQDINNRSEDIMTLQFNPLPPPTNFPYNHEKPMPSIVVCWSFLTVELYNKLSKAQP